MKIRMCSNVKQSINLFPPYIRPKRQSWLKSRIRAAGINDRKGVSLRSERNQSSEDGMEFDRKSRNAASEICSSSLNRRGIKEQSIWPLMCRFLHFSTPLSSCSSSFLFLVRVRGFQAVFAISRRKSRRKSKRRVGVARHVVRTNFYCISTMAPVGGDRVCRRHK